jgi:putative ABC transport system permease protein
VRLSAIAWRSLASRPLRTGLTVLGVALGVAVIAAALMAGQAATEAVRRAAQEMFGSATLRVRAFDPQGFTPRTVQNIQTTAGVNTGSAVIEERGRSVTTRPGPDEKVFTMLLIGVNPRDEAQIRSYELVDGHFLDPADPTGVLVNAAWARANGLGVGDELWLNRPDTKPLNNIVGLLGDAGFGALGSGSVMVLDSDFLSEAFATPAPIRYVDLKVAEGAEDQVMAALDRTMTEPFVIETVADAEQQLGRAQAGFAGLAFLFGLVALAVGAFLVANTLAMTLTERTREVGLLRAAGTTSRQVLGLFLRQGLALGLLGGAVGVLLGVAVAAVLITVLQSSRALLISGLPFHPVALLLAFLLGALVTLAGALAPALAASRVPPLDALRPSQQPGRTLGGRLPWVIGLVIAAVAVGVVAYPLQRGSASLPGALLAVGILLGGALLVAIGLQPFVRLIGRPFSALFGAQGELGRANLGRDPVRTGLTVGALAIGLASVVALGIVTASARATADVWVRSILPGGYAIRLTIADDIDRIRDDLATIPGVDRVIPISEFPAVAGTDDGQREVGVAGIGPSEFQDTGSLIFTAGRRQAAFNALRHGGAVLLPESIADREDLAIGDTIRLSQPGGDEVPFTVAGVVAYSLPTRTTEGAILMSQADARESFGVTEASLYALSPMRGVPADTFRDAVTEKAASYSAEALSAAQLASDLGRSLDRLIGLFDLLAVLAVVIGGLGIVNTLAVGVLERGREIAILRSHGMTVGQVQAMVVTEAGIIGAVGGIAAVAIGAVVAWITIAVAAPGDFAGGIAIPWALLAAVVLLGIGVASVAGIYPARTAASLPITDSLKHFE